MEGLRSIQFTNAKTDNGCPLDVLSRSSSNVFSVSSRKKSRTIPARKKVHGNPQQGAKPIERYGLTYGAIWKTVLRHMAGSIGRRSFMVCHGDHHNIHSHSSICIFYSVGTDACCVPVLSAEEASARLNGSLHVTSTSTSFIPPVPTTLTILKPGRHTTEILKELNTTVDEMQQLHHEGAISEHVPSRL